MMLLWTLILNFAFAHMVWTNQCDHHILGHHPIKEGHFENKGTKIPIRYKKAQAGKPTVILVNGLVYDSGRWDAMKNILEENGFGTITYHHRGQWEQMSYLDNGQTLNASDVSLKNNVDDLKKIADEILPDEKVNLISLSYGASIAAEFTKLHPEKIENTFFLSPLIKSLEYYEPQGAMIRQQMNMMGMFGPMGQYWANMYYENVFGLYFNNLPMAAEKLNAGFGPSYKKALFEQAKTVKDFNLHNYKFSANHDLKIHLFLAGKEEAKYIPDQRAFWEKVSDNQRGSFVTFPNAYHTIPDSHPQDLAQEILNVFH